MHQVFFHRGFACTWHVTKPMTKHYAYYGEVIYFFLIFVLTIVIVMKDGEEIAANPSIACDTCGAECWEESYLTKVLISLSCFFDLVHFLKLQK